MIISWTVGFLFFRKSLPLSFSFPFHSFIILCLYTCVRVLACVHMLRHACGSQRTACRSGFLLPCGFWVFLRPDSKYLYPLSNLTGLLMPVSWNIYSGFSVSGLNVTSTCRHPVFPAQFRGYLNVKEAIFNARFDTFVKNWLPGVEWVNFRVLCSIGLPVCLCWYHAGFVALLLHCNSGQVWQYLKSCSICSGLLWLFGIFYAYVTFVLHNGLFFF